MELFKEFRIEAAHFLPFAPEGHKCRRMHGHSFRIVVFVSGPLDSGKGWVIDYADITKAFASVHDTLDHRLLNEIPGLENPTSEKICMWVWERIKPSLAGLSKIQVYETCTSGCIYIGE